MKTTRALLGLICVGLGDLRVRVVVRLVIARPLRVGPADSIAVAAVFGRAVGALERVREGQIEEVAELPPGEAQEPARAPFGELREALGAEAAQLRLPALLIQGADDAYGTVAQLDAIAEVAQGATSRLVLAACGHAPHRDQPEAVLAAICGFLEQFL